MATTDQADVRQFLLHALDAVNRNNYNLARVWVLRANERIALHPTVQADLPNEPRPLLQFTTRTDDALNRLRGSVVHVVHDAVVALRDELRMGRMIEAAEALKKMAPEATRPFLSTDYVGFQGEGGRSRPFDPRVERDPDLDALDALDGTSTYDRDYRNGEYDSLYRENERLRLANQQMLRDRKYWDIERAEMLADRNKAEAKAVQLMHEATTAARTGAATPVPAAALQKRLDEVIGERDDVLQKLNTRNATADQTSRAYAEMSWKYGRIVVLVQTLDNVAQRLHPKGRPVSKIVARKAIRLIAELRTMLTK